ncbi:MAG TPA: DUF190 domain-containing protein [Solirubrobacteraceae bacterium]
MRAEPPPAPRNPAASAANAGGSGGSGGPGESRGDEHMTLATYFGERERVAGHLLADRLLDLYGEHKIRGSILLRGVQGFGSHHRLRTDRLLTLSEDLPVLALAVDTRERIEALLPQVAALQRRGLTTVGRVRVVSAGMATGGGMPAGERSPATDWCHTTPIARPPDPAGSEAVKLTIHLGRRERVDGQPAFAAVCELLHAAGVAGASTLLGVDGTRAGRRERARFFAANSTVPMMILAVGSTQLIEAVLPRLHAMLHDPLVTLQRVRVCKRDGQLIEAPHETTDTDAQGRAVWQKLTIVTSEAARHDGRAVHLELIRRLRAAGAAGATSLRGVWGFHGAHAPHGDRLLSLRRHVPVLSILVDTPERVAQLFGIVDELTAERGLVTSETVRAGPSIVTASRGCSSVG